MNEQDLANHIKNLQELKKQDAKIDIATLALSALATHADDLVSAKDKRWGYLVSISVPPFGLIYALKFYTSGKSDGKSAAYICVALTVISIIVLFAFSGLLFKGSGLTTSQIQQTPKQLQDVLQP